MIDIEMTPERFAQLAPAIQQKILAARAAAERREAKKEDREALKDWLRLQELQAIPVKQRSKDEHNEFQRLYRKQKRLAGKGEQTITERVDDRVRSAEQFWQLNRLSLTNKIPAWKERQEDVLATLDWMDRIDNGTETPENCGENYVSLEEGVQDILDDIKEHGVAHLGYLYADEDIPRDWADGSFTGRAFWKTPEVFHALCRENEPTSVYVTTGLLIALPDWRAISFLQEHCVVPSPLGDRPWSWQEACEAVGMKFDKQGKVFYE